jgi:hypothetical protein
MYFSFFHAFVCPEYFILLDLLLLLLLLLYTLIFGKDYKLWKTSFATPSSLMLLHTHVFMNAGLSITLVSTLTFLLTHDIYCGLNNKLNYFCLLLNTYSGNKIV